MNNFEFDHFSDDIERFCVSAYANWPTVENLETIGARIDTDVINDRPDIVAISPLEADALNSGQFGPFIQKFSWGLQIDVWGTPDHELIYSIDRRLPKDPYVCDFGAVKLAYDIAERRHITDRLYLVRVNIDQV